MFNYIWRDAVDKNQFWIGSKGAHGYTAWWPVFVDSVFDLFGQEACEWVKTLQPGVPEQIQITLRPA